MLRKEMRTMNNINLIGRLTKDPECKYTANGKCVCTFSLAVDRMFKNADGTREADFFNCEIWGKIAEIAGNSLLKGHRCAISGRIENHNYTGQDGQRHYFTKVIGNSIDFLQPKPQSQQQYGGQQQRYQQPPTAPQAQSQTPPPQQQQLYGGQQQTAAPAHMDKFGQQVPFDEYIPF